MSAIGHRHSTPPQSLGDHIRRSLVLAIPVMFARAGMVIMIMVDTVMVGRAGAGELAYYAISLAPHIFLLVAGLGMLIGIIVLTAQADGAGRPLDAGGIWHMGLVIALVIGLVQALVMQWGEEILLVFGQDPTIASEGAEALLGFAVGMPAIMMYIATSFFLEGLNRPRAGMVIALTANFLNAALNWAMIGGHLGAPEMGADGATLATSITRWVMLVAIVYYAATMRGADTYGIRYSAPGKGRQVVRLLRIGIPLSAAVSMESAAFSLMATFAGRLGETPLAAYQISFNLIAFIFMFAIGLSTSTSVRVANAVGRQDPPGLVAAGWTGTGLCAVLMVAAGVLIALFRPEIAALYTSDEAVRMLVIPALLIVAALVVFDGLQAVLMGALRGLSDVLVPTLMQAVAFWAIAVPLAWHLGLQQDWGIRGLMTGALVGLIAGSTMLAARFSVASRRPAAAS